MAEEQEVTPKKSKKQFFSGTGRRKFSIARVWLYPDKGEVIVNGMPIKEYFRGREETLEWVKPFHAVGVSHPQAKFSATIKVAGGGKTGQVLAVRHGIARALVAYDPENRAILRTSELLTRDPRTVERKKPYLKKARKAPQYSKR